MPIAHSQKQFIVRVKGSKSFFVTMLYTRLASARYFYIQEISTMKIFLAIALTIFVSQTIIADGITIQNLPNAPESPNPVCRDDQGKLSNCTSTAGVSWQYLSPAAVDANNEIIGTVVDLKDGYVFSRESYIGRLDRQTGTLWIWGNPAPYFTLPDCQGEPYLNSDYLVGNVFPFYNTISKLYYVDKNEVESSVDIKSHYSQTIDYNYECVNTIERIDHMYHMRENDPQVTGFTHGSSNDPYAPPIKLLRPSF